MSMKRRFTGFLCGTMAAVLLAGTLPVFAETEAAAESQAVTEMGTADIKLYEDLNYLVSADGTVTITNCMQSAVTCVVPEEIDGCPVTSIAADAFAECYFLEELVLPDTVTTIQRQAFSACSALESVTLPKRLETLAAGAFDGCSALKEVIVPAGITELPQATFYECTALEKVTLPEGLEIIGSEAFYNCTSLKELVLPESTTTLSDYAFQGCAALTDITLPENVAYLGQYIFQDCKGLTAIEVDEANTVFCDKDGVLFTEDGVTLVRYPEAAPATEYRIPDGCTQAANGSFVDAVNLTTVDFNQAVLYGQDAFFRCSGLTEIILPEGVTDIATTAFAYCTALEKVTLPSTLKYIGDYAFYTCIALKEITIPEGAEVLGAYSFFNCMELKKLHLPDSITEIGDGAMGYYAESEDTEPQKVADFTVEYNSNQVIHDYVEQYGLTGSGSGTSHWWIWLLAIGGGVLVIGGIVLIVILRRRAYIPKPVPGGRQGSAAKRSDPKKKGKS